MPCPRLPERQTTWVTEQDKIVRSRCEPPNRKKWKNYEDKLGLLLFLLGFAIFATLVVLNVVGDPPGKYVCHRNTCEDVVAGFTYYKAPKKDNESAGKPNECWGRFNQTSQSWYEVDYQPWRDDFYAPDACKLEYTLYHDLQSVGGVGLYAIVFGIALCISLPLFVLAVKKPSKIILSSHVLAIVCLVGW